MAQTLERWTKLSCLVTRFPELLCVRKFNQLNIELLLYKQAELNQLEDDIEALRLVEGPDTAGSWSVMQSADEKSFAGQRKTLFDTLDEKMRTYRGDVLQVAQLQSLAAPSQISVDSVSRWLASSDGGNKLIKDVEGKPWWPEYAKDLVAMGPQPDSLDRTCMKALAPMCHGIIKRLRKPTLDLETGLGTLWWYAPRHFILVADLLCVLASALVPSASILALYYATSMRQTLVTIILFTLAFAGVVLLGFGCRRSETFAATVAFAAVQVVFVQLGVSNTEST